MSSQLIINIAILFSVILLSAISFSFLYYSTKAFSFAHGAIITLGAYLTFLFYVQFQLPLSIAILLGIAVSTLCGLSIELFIFRYLRRNAARLTTYLVISIGLYTVLQNLISLIWGDDVKALSQGDVSIGHNVLGAYITTWQTITICIAASVFVAVVLFASRTNLGKVIRAVSDNIELAQIQGVDTNRIILVCFAIGSSIGASAGILAALDTNMTPTMGFKILLYGVIAMIIGGVGSYGGLFAGALLVATTQHLAAYYIDTKWMDAVAYLILIAFLCWKPLGFSGQRLRKVEI